MIFAATYELILSGRKTQTRRIVKPGENLELAINKEDPYGAVFDTVIYRTYNGMGLPHNMALTKRTKWQVGNTYAVQPGRGKRTVFFKRENGNLISTNDPERYETYKYWTKANLRKNGWVEGRIRITAIRQERLQSISEEDAIAEGCNPIECSTCGGHGVVPAMDYNHHPETGKYMEWQVQRQCPACGGCCIVSPAAYEFYYLWDSIHTRPGHRWSDNPDVFVLTFELVSEEVATS